MSNGLNANIKLRRALASEWSGINPILLSGEPGVELDTFKLKIGDGFKTWNELPYIASGAESSVYNAILIVDALPETGNEQSLYKVSSTQKIYYWNNNNKVFDCLNYELNPDDFVDTNTDNIVLVNELPEFGADNLLYKLPDQTFYFWNRKLNAFAPLIPEISYPETPENPSDPNPPVIEVKGGIQVVATVEDLPEIGESDMLYKVLENELIYTWNNSTSSYKVINSTTASASSIVVVENFSSLPENGENDVLYKTNATQLLYMWNNLNKTYEQLGQGNSGPVAPEGYTITLQNTLDSRIFAVLQGNPVEISFRYSSIDIDGLNDGPGVGTLIVNDVKKATIAVPQKLNTLEISKYLSLGENNVQLIVENSESKTKNLIYQIDVINLQLTTDFKEMGIYTVNTEFPFVIIGSGKKTVHYLMDGEEIASEEFNNTNKLAHSFRIPMQTAGDHIFQVYADMDMNNMTIVSNTLTAGMMFVNDQMVNTFILSNFTQKESAQGNVINIPYLVYNPLNETSEVILNIYDSHGEIYSTKPIVVDQSVHNWIQQDYPAGNVVFEIVAKSDSGENAVKRFEIFVEESSFDLTPVATNLALEFNAQGRSNDEANPEYWAYGDIEADFERFAWSVADGWVESDSGETVLRFLPKNKMTIPFQPFVTDKRATGYTIEIEMATHNVKDYDATVISCVHEGRGFVVKAQSMVFKSEQSEEIITMFKDDERVRITITIEPQTLNRFIKLYVNGILCGVDQYKENDNFKQAVPQNITLGSDDCGLDLYKLRFYERNLSDDEQLNNFICDRSSIAERIAVRDRNAIYDISGNLTIGSLPPTIPYLVMQCEELPQFKGDKKKKKSVYFVDRLHPERNFSASDCQFDVQGTSSAGYPIKNFKVKFGSGIDYANGTHADGFPIREGDLVSKCLCLKADFASSEQANNVMLVDYYDELVRDYFLTPAQEEDPRVRTGIAGRPIVVFWENTTTGEIKFNGQYNMNNDKSNENVFGFDRDKWPNTECWEFSNNTSDRTLFKKSEWLEEVYDEKEDVMIPAWKSDFEARFPDLDDPYSDYTQFKRFCDFIVSTNRDLATNTALMVPEVYDGVTYEKDSKEYRLAKFKAEFKDYAFVDTFIFYYIFTEVFHLMDSRAKNMFLTTFDGTHWFPIPYDMDTAIGINNEGDLVFEYDIEDTDKVNNENVFTGQDSALWHNVRDAFQARRFEMYDELRRREDIPFSFEYISNKMNEHQATWPEAIWNEDAKVKYLDIYLTEGEEYFEMCQGDKSSQRLAWLYNAFKYRDSKYRCGDSEEYSAFFRAYAPGDMTVTPFQHLWPRVDYTDSYPVSQRSKRNVENVLECPLDTASDTEIFLRSADRMSSFGDLSQYKADTVKFASATKLQELILGSSAEGYENHKLTAVELGNNRLISYLNVENCINLVNPIDLSQCYNLETVKARGSALNSITFPVGGHLETLELPGTFTNLTIRNQHNIENFSMASYENINTLWIDDTPGLPIEEMLLNTPKLDRVRIVNTTWAVSSEENLRTIFEKLKTCGGLDANGNNTVDEKAVMTGYVEIKEISDEFLEELNEFFKELIVIVDGKARFFIRYLNQDNSLLYKYTVSTGDDAIDPIAAGLIETPVLDGGEDTRYEFSHWSYMPTNIQGPQNLIAMYQTYYRVQFLDGNGKVVNTQWILKGEGAIDPVENGMCNIPIKNSDIQYHYVYSQWSDSFDVINAPIDIHAGFTNYLRDYPVYFYNGPECIQETREYYGTYAQYHGDETQIKKKIGDEESDYYEFAYWSPSISEPIVGPTYFYAQYVFDGYIEDSWTEIAQNVAEGNVDNYGYGGKKVTEISYSYKGTPYTDTVEFEIVDKEQDPLAQVIPGYNNDSNYAALTFRGKISARTVMNSGAKDWNGNLTLDGGGWAKSDMRAWLNGEDFYGNLPTDLKNVIKTVTKLSDNGYYDYHPGPASLTSTDDKIFIASAEELNALNKRYTMAGQGEPYVLFTDDASRKMDGLYWTRSTAGAQSFHAFCVVDGDGRITTTGGGNKADIIVYFSV